MDQDCIVPAAADLMEIEDPQDSQCLHYRVDENVDQPSQNIDGGKEVKNALKSKVHQRRQEEGKGHLDVRTLFPAKEPDNKLSPEEIEKRDKRKELNRKSAKRSRERKQQDFDNLQQKLKHHTSKNEKLRDDISDLEKKVGDLGIIIRTHELNCRVYENVVSEETDDSVEDVPIVHQDAEKACDNFSENAGPVSVVAEYSNRPQSTEHIATSSNTVTDLDWSHEKCKKFFEGPEWDWTDKDLSNIQEIERNIELESEAFVTSGNEKQELFDFAGQIVCSMQSLPHQNSFQSSVQNACTTTDSLFLQVQVNENPEEKDSTVLESDDDLSMENKNLTDWVSSKNNLVDTGINTLPQGQQMMKYQLTSPVQGGHVQSSFSPIRGNLGTSMSVGVHVFQESAMPNITTNVESSSAQNFCIRNFDLDTQSEETRYFDVPPAKKQKLG